MIEPGQQGSSGEEPATFVRGGPACAFCTTVLSETEAVALITLRSRAHGQRYFGAHARCLQAAMRPDIARFLELSDVPPGLRDLLPLNSRGDR
jgi:hypothetical protein